MKIIDEKTDNDYNAQCYHGCLCVVLDIVLICNTQINNNNNSNGHLGHLYDTN